MIKANKADVQFSGTILTIDKDVVNIMRTYKEMVKEHEGELPVKDAKEHLHFLVDTAFKSAEELEAEVKKMKEDKEKKSVDEIIEEIESDDDLPDPVKTMLAGLGKMLKEMGAD